MRLHKKAAIDTNMLLLVICAACRQNPSRSTRLSRYNEKDIQIIENLVSQFDKLVTTPNILTETSNMTVGFEAYNKLKDFSFEAFELYVPSKNTVINPLFCKLGLTDSCFFSEEFTSCSIITDDLELSQFLRSQDRSVVYYQEYRELYMNQI